MYLQTGYRSSGVVKWIDLKFHKLKSLESRFQIAAGPACTTYGIQMKILETIFASEAGVRTEGSMLMKERARAGDC